MTCDCDSCECACGAALAGATGIGSDATVHTLDACHEQKGLDATVKREVLETEAHLWLNGDVKRLRFLSAALVRQFHRVLMNEPRLAASSTFLHLAPPPTLSISSHLQSIGSEKKRHEKFSHSSTFSKFHAGAAAATVIQRVWRSHISRLIQSDLQHLQTLVLLERSVLNVQRCWRGHMGRFEASAAASKAPSLPPPPPTLLVLKIDQNF